MSDVPKKGERWRHKARKIVYEVITSTAGVQCSSSQHLEELCDDWTIYINEATGKMWVRPTKEFMDGWFERVP